jgi:hypothetical protein
MLRSDHSARIGIVTRMTQSDYLLGAGIGRPSLHADRGQLPCTSGQHLGTGPRPAPGLPPIPAWRTVPTAPPRTGNSPSFPFHPHHCGRFLEEALADPEQIPAHTSRPPQSFF